MDKKEYIIPSVKTHAMKSHLLLANSNDALFREGTKGTQQVYGDIEMDPEDAL